MGKFTTTSKKEALQTGKIYLDTKSLQFLSGITNKKIYRCAYCLTELREGNRPAKVYNKYCSDWCREMGHSKHFELHKCIGANCNKQIPYGAKKCDACKLNKTTKYCLTKFKDGCII